MDWGSPARSGSVSFVAKSSYGTDALSTPVFMVNPIRDKLSRAKDQKFILKLGGNMS